MPRSSDRRGGLLRSSLGSAAVAVMVCALASGCASPVVVGQGPGHATTCRSTAFPMKSASRPGPIPVLDFIPTAALVCRYGSDASHEKVVRGALVTSASRLREIAEQANTLVPIASGTVFHCPMDNGGFIDVSLWSDTHDLRLRVQTSGCRFIERTGGVYRQQSGSFVADLTSLTR